MSELRNTSRMTSAGNRLAEDSVALVTGAGSGIGRAISKALVLAGGLSHIYLLDIHAPGLHKTEELLQSLRPSFPSPTEIHTIDVDISCPLTLKDAFSSIPRLDYAINCASVTGHAPKPTTDLTLADFDSLNDVNYRGLWMCQKQELNLMLKNNVRPYARVGATLDEARIRGQRGAIVNVLHANSALRAQTSIYSATKAAGLALTKADACEFGRPPQCIRINAVSPGLIDTQSLARGEGLSQEMKDAVNTAVEITPMARLGLATEVADACVFLCSGESSFMTGANLVVDGGYTIQ